ncbi:mucin-5AC isoform X1 [Anastrepha obliqua]|uniref:mucin-5AC isoform X1 n=1 Tax=Anastrepha obliqua TaxID=95512 RepID=UPI00240A211E|nr:mucin-5AC isoform X1 [Anastrepha obliqua]
MQNVESQPEIPTDDLDLAKVGSTTPSSELERTASTVLIDLTSAAGKVRSSNIECAQSDPETRRKSKARSRFTSALRKLSGRKKRTTSKDTSTESSLAGGASIEIVSAPETVISSGGEDTADTNATATPEAKPKKKSKLARRFLLGSLKKSKSSTKKSIDEDDEGDVVQGSQEETPFEDADDGDLPNVEVEESLKRKVKISLSDSQQSIVRKLEDDEVDEQQQLTETNGTAATRSSSITDYLIPIEDKAQPSGYESGGDEVPTTPATLAEDSSPVTSPAPGASTKKKKPKTKKSAIKEAAVTIIKTTATTSSGSTIPTTSTQKHTAATVQKTTRTTTVTTDEKFVITQSTRDTPPRERAPAKPSRVATTAQPPIANLTPTSTGAIRKTNTRSSAALTSPSLGREQRTTSFGAVSIAATVASKRQRANSGKNPSAPASSRSASNRASSSLSTGSATTVTSSSSSGATTKSRKADTELMQNPLQRGHRFPKPSTTTITAAVANTEAIAASKASASATTKIASRITQHNAASKLATPTPTSEQFSNKATLIADVTTVEENHTKPTNATYVSPDTPNKADESAGTLEAIQKQIQFQLESHASFNNNQLQQSEHHPKQHQQQKLLVAPQLLVDDTASPPQSLQSNASLSDYQQPPSYTPPPPAVRSFASTPLATPETQSSSHTRHPSSSKVIFPDPDVYNDVYADKSEALLFIADESVTTASSSGADDVVSSAESAQPSDYSGNNIRNPNLPGRALRNDFEQEEKTHGPPLQPTVRFAVGSVVRPQGTSFDNPLHDQSSYDSNISSDSHSDASRRRIRYVAQPTTFDAEFESILQRHNTVDYNQALASEYSVDSEYDSGDNQMPAFGDLTMEQEMEPTIMTSANAEKREHLYKILVIGELGTGKTSFIKRYVHQFFSQNYRATIGVDFALKVLHWDANTTVRLQLWDIAGQERFGNMTRVYYKEAVGAFIVFDVTRSGTFECVSKWKEDLDSKVQLPDGSPIPCILLANKCDQEKQGIVTSPEKMDEYVQENGFAGWYETSAKENINIDEAARALVNKILLNDRLISDADLADSDKFNLNNSGEQTTSSGKSKCSC